MYIVTDLQRVPADIPPSVVTIGKFDGLHIGHRWLLSLVREEAEQRGLNPVVVTFDRHPQELFNPERAPRPILSMRQKIELLRLQGLKATVVLEFTKTFAAVTAEDFIRDVLVGKLGVKLLIVGRDFRFGARGAGTVQTLLDHSSEYGYEVLVPDDAMGPDGRRSSSTWVRELLEAGDVKTAHEILGRHHVVAAEVVHGAKRGRQLGYPTANLSPNIEGLIPGDGVYAGWLSDGDKIYPSAISIGNNPTFDGVPQRQVEAHVIGTTLALYGREVQIAFVERIRGMEKFSGLDELIERIALDVSETKRILTAENGHPLPSDPYLLTARELA